jgi:hypothetical protein
MTTSTTPTAITPVHRRRLVVPSPDDPLGLFGDGPPNLLKPQASDRETGTPATHCKTVSR